MRIVFNRLINSLSVFLICTFTLLLRFRDHKRCIEFMPTKSVRRSQEDFDSVEGRRRVRSVHPVQMLKHRSTRSRKIYSDGLYHPFKRKGRSMVKKPSSINTRIPYCLKIQFWGFRMLYLLLLLKLMYFCFTNMMLVVVLSLFLCFSIRSLPSYM